MKRVDVAAGVLEDSGRYLIARRKAGGPFGNSWEFPGGKLEQGERPEAALERELFEELGIRVSVGTLLSTDYFENGGTAFCIYFYRVDLREGSITLNDHEELRWALPSEMAALELAPADRKMVEGLARSPQRGANH